MKHKKEQKGKAASPPELSPNGSVSPPSASSSSNTSTSPLTLARARNQQSRIHLDQQSIVDRLLSHSPSLSAVHAQQYAPSVSHSPSVFTLGRQQFNNQWDVYNNNPYYNQVQGLPLNSMENQAHMAEYMPHLNNNYNMPVNQFASGSGSSSFVQSEPRLNIPPYLIPKEEAASPPSSDGGETENRAEGNLESHYNPSVNLNWGHQGQQYVENVTPPSLTML